jgi:hypothetical protein
VLQVQTTVPVVLLTLLLVLQAVLLVELVVESLSSQVKARALLAVRSV